MGCRAGPTGLMKTMGCLVWLAAAPAAPEHHAAKLHPTPPGQPAPPPPSTNAGPNCFRSLPIQQEFSKAHQLCTMHPGEYPADEYPILSRLCKMLP